MSHLSAGLISAYNSLTDRHLAGYFSNTRIRRHLQRAGLITRSGRIVPDKEYRHALIQRAHRRHVRECLAQAIFHKVLEMERVHQIDIKRKLEEFARRERVHKIKVERPKRYEEDIVRILSPRPPTGAKSNPKQHSGPEGEHSESSESPGSSRPNTAPGKLQRPARLKPIRSSSTAASLRRRSPGRLLESSNEKNGPLSCTMDKVSRRRVTTAELSHGISPYCLPVINNFVTPVPPATKRKERGAKVTASGALRGRRLRPTTASSGPDVTEDPPALRSSVHQSRVCVNMIYFGKAVHLSHDLADARDEIKVFQQHCGGENLCVFRGRLREGETFQFISRRHRGFPFSLTFFLSGLQVERLSSCCEFKHRKGPRLGGRHGHFGFCGVEGASPCYKCIIAMGLDKKPTPPPKRVNEDDRGGEESSPGLGVAPRTETERSGRGEAAARPRDAGARAADGTDAGEDKAREDYEEDFEADDEGPPGDVEAGEIKSSSPSGETGGQADEGDASESEDEERDEDMKSNSSSSTSQSDAEATKDSEEDERADEPGDVRREQIAAPPGEVGPNGHEAAALTDSDARDDAGEEAYDASRDGRSDDPSGDGQVEETVDGDKREERERAKSVQEKLAEAILKESQCSSEPELSDTSTEEEEDGEEESTDKGPEKDSKVKSVTLEEETACEEDVGGENQPSKGPEQEPQGNSDVTRDEKVQGEKDKTPAENTKPEISEEAIGEDHEASAPQEDAAARSTEGEPAENNGGNETGRATKSGEADESSVSEPDTITEGTGDAEAGAMAARETTEMKVEPSEERSGGDLGEELTEKNTGDDDDDDDDALEEKCERGEKQTSPVEKTEVGNGEESDKEDKDEADEEEENDESKTEEKMYEWAKSDSNADGKQAEGDHGEEQAEGDHSEEQAEGDHGEEQAEGDHGEEQAEGDHGEEQAEGDHGEEQTKKDHGEEQAEKDHGEEDAKEANEEKAEESEKTERDEGAECVEKKMDEEDSEEKGAATDETNEGEKITTDGGKSGEAEKEEKAENRDEEESEEKNDEPAEGEEISEIPEESEKKPDLDEDNVKIPDENIGESEDAPDREAAQGTETPEEAPKDAEEAEDVMKETEGGSDRGEKAQLDVENGEKSAGAEDSAHEGEAQTEAEDDGDTSDGRRTEGPTAAPEESGGDPEEREGDKVVMESSDEQQRNVGEVAVASSADRVQPSPDAAVDPGDSGSTAPSDARTDGDKAAAAAAAAALDLSGAAGGNGADTEEASKASEEGASVLLRPQARLARSNEEEEEEEEESEAAAGGDAPHGLAGGDNADLVTNWVTMHQTSRCFETFVEPLGDLSGSSPLGVEGASDSAQQEDVSETGDKSEGDTAVSNVESGHTEEGDGRRVDEETETKDSTPKTESGTKSASRPDVRSEGREGSGGTAGEDGVTQDTCERPGAPQTDAESTASSGGPGIASQNRTEEGTGGDGAEKATTAGEEKDLSPSSGSGEPPGPGEAGADDGEGTRGKSGEQRRHVTEITDFTPPESDEGGRSPSPDAGTDGDKRDAQLIEDIRGTLPVKTC